MTGKGERRSPVALDIIGCGEVIVQFHAPILRHLQRLKLLRVHGCYDRVLDRAQRAAARLGAATFGTEPPTTPAPDVSAVLVATPAESHGDAALPHLEAGRVALIEKPFVGEPSDANALLAAAASHGGRVLVGHMRRFSPSVRIARDFIIGGGLGPVRRIVSTEGGRWAWPSASNYVVEDLLGGVLYETGSHTLDTTLFVLGADQDSKARVDVAAVTRDRSTEPSHALRAELELATSSLGRIPIRLTLTRTEAQPSAVWVVGECATLIVPSAITSAPKLLVGRRVHSLDVPSHLPSPLDILGCLKQEHLALIAVCHDREVSTVLDGERFLLLTETLHALARGRLAA